MNIKKRMIVAISTGAILGLFCIIGVGFRMGFEGNELFIAATWFNRVLMGAVIGIAYGISLGSGNFGVILRGATIGLIVSAAHFLSSSFYDIPGFFAGIAYGIIIDLVSTKYGEK